VAQHNIKVTRRRVCHGGRPCNMNPSENKAGVCMYENLMKWEINRGHQSK